MTPEELELAKEGIKESVKQALAPVQDIVRRVGGPAATEVGLILEDYFRFWRLKHAVRLLEDVKQVTSDANLNLKPIAPRLLFPILDAATLEEEPELHRRWVALLTNAATDFDGEILPAFPDILRQLTSEEAQFLDKVYDEVTLDTERRRFEIEAANPGFKGNAVGIIGVSGKLLKSISPVLIENLERLKLVTRTQVPLSFTDKIVNVIPAQNHLHITELGRLFVRACRV